MDLILDMAENQAEQVARQQGEGDQGEGVKGEWEALKVPSGIAKVVENVFEVTEDVDGRGVEALEGLKEVVKPVLEFPEEDNEEDGPKKG